MRFSSPIVASTAAVALMMSGCAAFTLPPTRTINHGVGGRTTTTPSSSFLLNSVEESTTTPDESSSSSFSSSYPLKSSTEAHALEVFAKYASDGLYEDQKFISQSSSLFSILCSLDIEATQEDADIVFRYLDSDGDGRLVFNEEFLPWYLDAKFAATDVATSFQSLLIGRRTVDEFDNTPVDDAILKRAVQCAVAAPNRACSEPWRFITVGPQTIEKFADLNEQQTQTDDDVDDVGQLDWRSVAPGWCVVTTKTSSSTSTDDDDDSSSSTIEQEDFKSVCCAIQNFMLSMWSEGIGTKWTTGPVQKTPEFAKLCGISEEKERVVGIIWFGYATGGTKYADPRRRKLSVDDVLGYLP